MVEKSCAVCLTSFKKTAQNQKYCGVCAPFARTFSAVNRLVLSSSATKPQRIALAKKFCSIFSVQTALLLSTVREAPIKDRLQLCQFILDILDIVPAQLENPK